MGADAVDLSDNRIFVWSGIGVMETGDWYDIVVETDVTTGGKIFEKSVGRTPGGDTEILDVMTELVNQLQGHFKTAACRAQLTPAAPVMPMGGTTADLPPGWDGDSGAAEFFTVDGGALKLMVAGRSDVIRDRKPDAISPGMVVPADITDNGTVLVAGGNVLSPRLVQHIRGLGSAHPDRKYKVCNPTPMVCWALGLAPRAAA